MASTVHQAKPARKEVDEAKLQQFSKEQVSVFIDALHAQVGHQDRAVARVNEPLFGLAAKRI